jgi:hypothetical protein
MTSQVVSERFVKQLIADQSFFREFPEFKGLQTLSGKRVKRRGGCRRCGRGRKPEKQMLRSFISVLRSLDPDRLAALKKRANAQQLQFHGYNHIRRANEVMTL